MASDEKITDRIKIIAKQLSGKLDPDTDYIIPEYTIRGTGEMFCYNISERCFTKIYRGTLVFLLKENFDTDRTLIYTYSNELLLIDPEEIVYIGYD